MPTTIHNYSRPYEGLRVWVDGVEVKPLPSSDWTTLDYELPNGKKMYIGNVGGTNPRVRTEEIKK